MQAKDKPAPVVAIVISVAFFSIMIGSTPAMYIPENMNGTYSESGDRLSNGSTNIPVFSTNLSINTFPSSSVDSMIVSSSSANGKSIPSSIPSALFISFGYSSSKFFFPT